jgi:hypothetical protein
MMPPEKYDKTINSQITLEFPNHNSPAVLHLKLNSLNIAFSSWGQATIYNVTKNVTLK